ncbi:DNA-processing protein DprA [Bacillus sp. FJAT-45350]|uniref:DNA-processing protein DprA n=1 Tax=Bacillus sp. FJAT-45350 TaxID=2011014 RepID=UPI000BB8E687|nr:DNA-processing protein DprA [Bacillus sp. FJAT-45350]
MKEYWIWFSTIKNIGPVLQKRLLDYFPTPKAIFEADIDELSVVPLIGKKIAKEIKNHPLTSVEPILTKMGEKKIDIVTYDNRQFEYVFSCKRSPILFYYLGKLPEKQGIAIVGARRCTDEGKRAAEEIARSAAVNEIPIISGMAKGIDSYAHTSCLKENGYTVAVLAGGVDVCYPKEHATLYEKVIDSGMVLSASPPQTRPHPKYFVERNAHITAWSKTVVVVQAAPKSGSLTTAAFAKEQGRTLFAVPQSIYLQEGKGSNQLLVEGAKPYLNPASLGFKEKQRNHTSHRQATPTNTIENNILSFIDTQNISSIEEISLQLKIQKQQLLETLLFMEMNGLVKLRGGSLVELAH